MSATHVVNVDLARVQREVNGEQKLVTILAWGDPIRLVGETEDRYEVVVVAFRRAGDDSVESESAHGFISKTRPRSLPEDVEILVPCDRNRVLRLDFVDVQQGDGAVVETPAGKIVLVDGGDNQLFARYLANRFRGTSADEPKEIDCILISHGDADHFSGLTKIFASETLGRLPAAKRLFIHPHRVYHNGLVKRPSERNGKRVPDVELLGATKDVTDTATGRPITLVTALVDDLLAVPDAEMNEPFREWKKALAAYSRRGSVQFRRLSQGDHDAFDFLGDEGITARVLAPILTHGEDGTEGLLFLGSPPPGPRVGHDSVSLDTNGFRGKSASHTINGHSIVVSLSYGKFSALFSGDLNDQASRVLAELHDSGAIDLRSVVCKVPHHGSADFSGALLERVNPVVSVVSSGDETERKEFVHPRATLMGALGKYGRGPEPLIFVTELAAFFAIEGFVDPRFHHLTEDGRTARGRGENLVNPAGRGRFFALSRRAFGIVMVRTDGERMLVYSNSGLATLKEAYAYRLTDDIPEPTPVIRV